jgi:hypothetical protein
MDRDVISFNAQELEHIPRIRGPKVLTVLDCLPESRIFPE